VTAARLPDRELLRVTFDGATADWFYGLDRDLAYPRAGYHATGVPVSGGHEVTVEATTLLRDVCLFPDRLDPDSTVDRMLVTLLPGERARFEVRSARPLDASDLVSPPVLRCVNDWT
jgi:beta-mannosidase